MKILLFGVTQEIIGERTITVTEGLQDEIKTVRNLKTYLKENHPGLLSLTSFAIAVNMEYAHDDTKIQKGDEIALIPPVSGG